VLVNFCKIGGSIVIDKKSLKRLVICKSAGGCRMRNTKPPAADCVRKSDNRHVIARKYVSSTHQGYEIKASRRLLILKCATLQTAKNGTPSRIRVFRVR